LNRKVVRSKGGKREDLGGMYFRSAMEANVARVFEALKARAVILSWEHEPRVYSFTEFGYKRGPWAYTPDFSVSWNPIFVNRATWANTLPGARPWTVNLTDCLEIFEVKGREVGSDRSKMRRMRKHYPEIQLTLIGAVEYRAMAGFWKTIINGWEGR
jgi:hypothetical protein